ncbi:MAG TPA: 30S ribosomal protein S20 [Candidatus Paceibacterota bacterium]
MPITSSAKKALRASKKKAVYNVHRKTEIAKITKKIKKLVAEKNVEEARKLIPDAYRAIDKAEKTNYLKKNTASRKKSRLVAFIKKAQGVK